MYWIDAHAHISFFKDPAITHMIAEAHKQQLQFWMMAGYDAKDWAAQLEVQNVHPGAVATSFGLHPWRVMDMSLPDIEREMGLLERLLPQARALGETGIDKFKTQDEALIRRQTEIFERHMELNKIHNLPLVLHVVRAESEALAVLQKYSCKGIVHGYSGSYESAKRYVNLGYKISVGRGIFHTGYKNLKDCVDKLGLEHILLESDAGLNEQGQPEDAVGVFLKVADAVAQIKKITPEQLLEAQFKNFHQVFGV